jgi:hypothetical protein
VTGSAPRLQMPPLVELGPTGRGVKVFPRRGRALVFWCVRVGRARLLTAVLCRGRLRCRARGSCACTTPSPLVGSR